MAEKLTNEDSCSSRGILIPTITFEAVLRTMLAPIVPLAQCLHNFRYLGDKAGDVESGAEEEKVSTPRANLRNMVVGRKGYG